MTIEIKPETERLVKLELENGHFVSIDELIVKGIHALHGAPESPADHGEQTVGSSKSKQPFSMTREERRAVVRRLIEFGESNQLSLGEPVTRAYLHEGHRL